MGRGRGRSHGGSDNRAATVSPDDVTPRKPGELVVGWGGCNERERERDEKETNIEYTRSQALSLHKSCMYVERRK